MGRRLIIVSDHLPLAFGEENNIEIAGDPVSSAILAFVKEKANEQFTEIFWAGEANCERATWSYLSKLIPADFNCIPVFVPKRKDQNEISITTTTNSLSDPSHLNKLVGHFAEAIVINLRPSDVIWIHGHNLVPLAGILRKQLPELTIGLFIHIPFPSYNSFRLLPKKWQETLLNGMMSADLIGFHGSDHSINFLQCVLMVLGLDNERKIIHYEDRLVMVDSFKSQVSQQNYNWAFDFIPVLQKIKERQTGFRVKFLDEYTRRNLYDAYRSSKKRLILLDYDGTLVSFSSKPEMAVPGPELLELIQSLSASSANDVFLVSGRNKEFLEQHFGALPVNLIAEHGASYKWKNRDWIKEVDTNNEWKKDAHQLMKPYVENCEHSFVEEKEFSIAWHYRNADHEEGKLKAFELASELKLFVENRHLQVMMGKKIVELRQSGINKGSFVRKVIENEDYDYIFAAGDDRTDEDMFKALLNRDNAFTIKVGPEASYAEFNLHTPQMVLSLLQGFDHLSSAMPA